MKPSSSSLTLRIQTGFALGALLVVGLMALFMDQALRRSLEAEDAAVLRSQASHLLSELNAGKAPGSDARRGPEKAEWRLLLPGGAIQGQSPGRSEIPLPSTAAVRGVPEEIPGPGRRAYSRMTIPRGTPDGAWLEVILDRSHEADILQGFRRTLGLGVLLATLVAFALGRGLARAATAPLRRMAQEASAIRPGSLHQRLAPEHFPRELGELVGNLNAALARLQEAFERLSQLATDLSHELRTPLQNLRSGLEAVILRPVSGNLPDALGSALEECARLENLIGQMVLLARSEHPATELRKTPLDARQVLTDTADFFGAMAEEAGIALDVEAPEGLGFQADRPLVERALHNLVGNALAHTAPGGRLRLGASPGPGLVTLWVKDDGPGIPEALLPRLGHRWIRGTEGKGLGLGLAIVKSILSLHGGSMAIESRPGDGTQVRLSFPDPG